MISVYACCLLDTVYMYIFANLLHSLEAGLRFCRKVMTSMMKLPKCLWNSLFLGIVFIIYAYYTCTLLQYYITPSGLTYTSNNGQQLTPLRVLNLNGTHYTLLGVTATPMFYIAYHTIPRQPATTSTAGYPTQHTAVVRSDESELQDRYLMCQQP